MPQLDKLVFMSQLFWLVLTFLTLYIFLLKYVLPVVAKTLKVRKKQILANKTQTAEFTTQQESINAEYENIITKTLNNSNIFLGETITSSHAWSINVLKNVNETLFINANKQFLKASADIIGKNYLIKNLIKSN